MKKNMSEERALFRRALCEGLARKYEEALAAYPEPIPCSEEHLRKMTAIIESHAKSVKQAKYKRRLTALLLAAALLLLTACAAYAYRGEIKEILVKMREKYICLIYDEEEAMPNKSIAQYYTLEYVPEGYELAEKLRLASVYGVTWRNADGDYLIYEQTVWDGTSYFIDNEIGNTSIITCETTEVYYRNTQLHTYIWNDGTYSFVLSTSQPLVNDELKMILNGMKDIQ